MGLIAITFIAVIMTIYLSCRPFRRYWQIVPDPGNTCQPAVSAPIVWVSFITNVLTDIFLFFIPIPMLWKSSLRLYKKMAATLVLGAGVLIIICALLKSIYVIIVSIFSTVTHSKRACATPISLGRCVKLFAPFAYNYIGSRQWWTISGRMGYKRDVYCGCHDKPPNDLSTHQNLARTPPPEHSPLKQQQKSLQDAGQRFRDHWRRRRWSVEP